MESSLTVYTVMADDGGAYAWIKRPTDRCAGIGTNCADTFGGMDETWHGDHPVSAALAADLAAWQRLYEGAGALRDGEPQCGWRSFNLRGIELAATLKRELGDTARVRYCGQPSVVHLKL